jgi:hypothetical protein
MDPTQVRLECLKLAQAQGSPSEVLSAASNYADFVIKGYGINDPKNTNCRQADYTVSGEAGNRS